MSDAECLDAFKAVMETINKYGGISRDVVLSKGFEKRYNKEFKAIFQQDTINLYSDVMRSDENYGRFSALTDGVSNEYFDTFVHLACVLRSQHFERLAPTLDRPSGLLGRIKWFFSRKKRQKAQEKAFNDYYKDSAKLEAAFLGLPKIIELSKNIKKKDFKMSKEDFENYNSFYRSFVDVLNGLDLKREATFINEDRIKQITHIEKVCEDISEHIHELGEDSPIIESADTLEEGKLEAEREATEQARSLLGDSFDEHAPDSLDASHTIISALGDISAIHTVKMEDLNSEEALSEESGENKSEAEENEANLSAEGSGESEVKEAKEEELKNQDEAEFGDRDEDENEAEDELDEDGFEDDFDDDELDEDGFEYDFDDDELFEDMARQEFDDVLASSEDSELSTDKEISYEELNQDEKDAVNLIGYNVELLKGVDQSIENGDFASAEQFAQKLRESKNDIEQKLKNEELSNDIRLELEHAKSVISVKMSYLKECSKNGGTRAKETKGVKLPNTESYKDIGALDEYLKSYLTDQLDIVQKIDKNMSRTEADGVKVDEAIRRIEHFKDMYSRAYKTSEDESLKTIEDCLQYAREVKQQISGKKLEN